MPSTQSDDKKAEGSRIAPRKGSCTDDKSTRVPRQNVHDLSARQHEAFGWGWGRGNFRELVKVQGKIPIAHVRKYQSGGLIGTDFHGSGFVAQYSRLGQDDESTMFLRSKFQMQEENQ